VRTTGGPALGVENGAAPDGERGRRRWILIPWAMTTLRLCLAPVLPAFLLFPLPRPFLALIVGVAFLSDWLDGVVARRLGVAVPWLRRYDVVADTAFYVAALAMAVALEPGAFLPFLPWMALLLAAELLVQIWHYRRWGAAIATHSWTCKAWGVVMSVSLAVLLGFGVSGWLLTSVFILASIAYIDVILILLFARRVPLDVISCWHVWQAGRAGRGAA
jgi:phosphatidylglycerophosphate synthase